jgi:hypothetical protein
VGNDRREEVVNSRGGSVGGRGRGGGKKSRRVSGKKAMKQAIQSFTVKGEKKEVFCVGFCLDSVVGISERVRAREFQKSEKLFKLFNGFLSMIERVRYRV